MWLRNRHVGVLYQRGAHTCPTFDVAYREDPDRPVLGMYFEDSLLARQTSSLRLAPWFSNLLPEGKIRGWVAEDRGVSVDREMELLATLDMTFRAESGCSRQGPRHPVRGGGSRTGTTELPPHRKPRATTRAGESPSPACS